jgi:adenine-specific DNA-methyltransferase
VIKYLGSKRRLVPLILEVNACLGASARAAENRAPRLLDLFSGTARVGHALKRAGFEVVANDHTAFAHALARCYVQADRGRRLGQAGPGSGVGAGDRWRLIDEVRRRLGELRSLRPAPGYFTETFCERSRYLRPENGALVDAMRDRIARWREDGLDGDVEAVLLVALMEAADRVDSTTGVQTAYLKEWAARAYKPLELRVPDVLEGPGRALFLDAAEAAARVEADIAYLDPPYNQHSYLGNYHVWESLVRWDKPEVYGVACKRVDCREYGSAFNSRRRAAEAFAALVAAVRAPRLVVSFNDEGFLERAWIEELLACRGQLVVLLSGQRRYVGAQIGIYDPRGQRVGRPGRVHNTEYLYVVTPDPAEADRLRRLAGPAAVTTPL